MRCTNHIKFKVRSPVHSHVTFYFLAANHPHSAPLWKATTYIPSSMRETKFLRPNKTPLTIILLYILIFTILERKLEGKNFVPNNRQLSMTSTYSRFHQWNFDMLWCSHIFELFHPFKGVITDICVVILFCMLVSRHDLILHIYFYTHLLTSDYWSFRFFFPSMYTSTQHIYIIRVSRKVMRII